ncbi:glycoside hydrolase family 27 protein [Glycomyces niveus]|uniref:Alpha-galactosidase n=1 Tax=Glycomyces niveus TaxID=2820287 RepID=A0ABS3U9B9_9ACTN|nr:glycoside hydrolase family 27 protein [Glycomyces sp. NEAU-S30]MBO3735370.1 glycoside hydrolase family 27 protein [Glycomyces sp. NEAU-S30]
MTRLAATPPMGWNSWDVFGTSVTEAETRANAAFIAEHMAGHGWEYVVVDIQWYDPAARAGGYNLGTRLTLDEYGLPQPAPNRFPSAADGAGFKPLADYIHSLGLKFGVHVLRGVPRQAVAADTPIKGSEYSAAQIPDRERISTWIDDNWGIDHSHPGGQAYYDALVRQFADWGVDYIKADDMIAPYWEDEVEAFWHAVDRADRDIVLSLSPGMSLSTSHAQHLQEHSHLWRISADLWDRWRDIDAQFDRLRDWAPYAGPGHWPDADMLPLGRMGLRAEVGEPRQSLLTPDEQRTLLTLWCIARSPLMVGADLPTSSTETIELLTNPEVLAAQRHPAGAREVWREDRHLAWASTDGAFAAVFNRSTEAAELQLPWETLGLSQPTQVRDCWSRSDIVPGDHLRAKLQPHSAALFRLS